MAPSKKSSPKKKRATARKNQKGGTESLSSISSGIPEQSQETLQKLLIEIQQSSFASKSSSNSSNSNTSNSGNSGRSRDPDVQEMDAILATVERKINFKAMKIVKMIRYLADPLRLAMKVRAMAFPSVEHSSEARYNFIASLSVNDHTKNNLMHWSDQNDLFGLFMLKKMKFFSTNILNQSFYLSHVTEYNNIMSGHVCAPPGHILYKACYYLLDSFKTLQAQGLGTDISYNAFLAELRNDPAITEPYGDPTHAFDRKIAAELNMFALGIMYHKKRDPSQPAQGQERTLTTQVLLDDINSNFMKMEPGLPMLSILRQSTRLWNNGDGIMQYLNKLETDENA